MYVKSGGVYTCPDDSSTALMSGATTNGYGAALPYHNSYVCNAEWGNPLDWPLTPEQLTSVVKPATTVLLCDGGVQLSATAPYVTATSEPRPAAWLLPDPSGAGNYGLWGIGTTPEAGCAGSWNDGICEAAGGPALRHTNMADCLLADGHVKAMQIGTWYYPNTPWLNPAQGG